MTTTRIYGSALLLWVSPFLLAAGGRGCGADDEENIQGRWIIVEMVMGGEAEGGVGGFLTFDRGKLIGEYDGETEEGWYRLDESTEPSGIDMGSKDETYAGIYVIDDDELSLCFSEEGETNRPTAFTSEKRSKNVLIRLKRIE